MKLEKFLKLIESNVNDIKNKFLEILKIYSKNII